MRLLQLVPCARRPPPQPQPKPTPPPAARRADQSAPLSPTTPPTPENHRRGAALGAGPQWRPSLDAISEDCSAAAVMTVAKTPPVKTKTTAKAKRRVLPREDRDDFRHVAVPTVVPSFLPTAFFF